MTHRIDRRGKVDDSIFGVLMKTAWHPSLAFPSRSQAPPSVRAEEQFGKCLHMHGRPSEMDHYVSLRSSFVLGRLYIHSHMH